MTEILWEGRTPKIWGRGEIVTSVVLELMLLDFCRGRAEVADFGVSISEEGGELKVESLDGIK